MAKDKPTPLTPDEQRDAIADYIGASDLPLQNKVARIMSSDITNSEAELAYQQLKLKGPEKNKKQRKERMFSILNHPNPPQAEKRHVGRVLLIYVDDTKVEKIYKSVFGHKP